MKNALIKSFLAIFILCNIIFFQDIISIFYVVSDALWAVSKFDVMCVVFGCLYLLLFLSFIIYFFKHREKNEIIQTVEFNSPKDMTPTEVGFLVDGKIDSGDISSLMVFWAGKKYIEIIDNKKSKKIKKCVDSLPENSNDYEKLLFAKIFGKAKEVQVSDISNKLSNDTTVQNVVRAVESKVGKKYFNSKSIWIRQLFICLFALLFFVTVMYFRLEYFADIVPIVEIFAIVATALFLVVSDWFLNYYDYRHKNHSSKGRTLSFVVFLVFMTCLVGLCMYFFWTDYYQVVFLVCAISILFVVVFLSRYISIYSKEGIKRLGQILGFRNFIEVAESDRIVMLVEENPNIFYEILPYAYVLGVSDKWIKQLDVVKNVRPEIVPDNVFATMILYSTFFTSPHLNFINIMHIANASKIATEAISLGANGGSGGTRGGSNFGGIRRR